MEATTMKNKKDFDAVELMRSIRTKLHEQFEKNPALRRKKLEEIRKKYRIRKRRAVTAVA